MELQDAIFTRRSVRNYNDTLVKEEVLKKIIEAGCWAPSACNIQGWKFIVIDDNALLRDIINEGAAAFLKNANQAILVLYDNCSDNLEYHDYIQSAAACIQNMLLMAHSMDVGTCWVNFLPPKNKLRKILGIPKVYDPVAMISLGYYSQQINDRKRKYEIDKLISKNRYSCDEEEKKKPELWKLRVKRILRRLYFLFPFKKLLNKLLDKKEKKFDN